MMAHFLSIVIPKLSLLTRTNDGQIMILKVTHLITSFKIGFLSVEYIAVAMYHRSTVTKFMIL